jgi:hypothetical protein
MARVGDRRGAYKVLVYRSAEKRPFLKPMLIGEDDIKMYPPKSGMWRHGME